MRLTALAFALLLLAAEGATAAILHVSPGGDDSHPGTAGQPLATLAAARDATRKLAPGSDGDIVIELADGTHLLTETLVLGPADSLPDGRRLIFRAAPGAKPVLSSALPVTNWQPSTLGENIREADLAPFASQFRNKPALSVLYRGTERLPRASSDPFHPDGSLLREHEVIRNIDIVNKQNNRTLHFPEGTMQPYANLADVEILIRPLKKWLVNYLPLESVDPATRTARTSVAGTYALECIEYGSAAKAGTESVWVEGALEHLDEEGEWAVDTAAGKLYLVSKDEPRDIRLPVLQELIRVEGRIDEWGEDVPVRGIVFEGLAFTGTDRMRWHEDLKGLQHDWDFYDAPNAALRFRGAEDCAVRDCRFFATGENAIRFDLYAQGNTVANCRFEELGGGGVLLAGYGPGTKDMNRGNRIAGNFFTRCGQLVWHAPAIHVWQSGANVIEHNRIVEMPYNGIVLSGMRARFFPQLPRHKRLVWVRDGDEEALDGLRELLPTVRLREIGEPRDYADVIPFLHCRDNIVRANEISDCVLRLSDGNGIYISAVGTGNVVERNLIYNVHGTLIRPDDDTFGVTIRDNLLLGSYSGIRLKHVNHAVNNLIYLIDSNGGGILFDDRPDQLDVLPDFGPSLIRRNLCVLPDLPPSRWNDPIATAKPAGETTSADVNDNLYWYRGNAARSEAFLKEWQARWPTDKNSVAADPRFADGDRFDFRLPDDSPALALGFKPFEMDDIGLPDDPGLPRLRRDGFPPRAPSHDDLRRAAGHELTIDLSQPE